MEYRAYWEIKWGLSKPFVGLLWTRSSFISFSLFPLFLFFFFSLARRYSIGTQSIVGLNLGSNQRTEAEKVYRCSFCSWTRGSSITLVILLLPCYRPHFEYLGVLLHQSHSNHSILPCYYSSISYWNSVNNR